MRAFSIFVVFFALSVVFWICFAKVCLGSNVRPSIFMVLSVGSVVLLIVSLSFVKCSAGCGVNSTVCVFEGARIRLFCLVQLYMSCRYACTCCLAVFMFVLVEGIVMSSAYAINFILLFGSVGMSDVCMLKTVGESTPPCGTLAFIVACFDFVLLYIVNCFVPRI